MKTATATTSSDRLFRLKVQIQTLINFGETPTLPNTVTKLRSLSLDAIAGANMGPQARLRNGIRPTAGAPEIATPVHGSGDGKKVGD